MSSLPGIGNVMVVYSQLGDTASSVKILDLEKNQACDLSGTIDTGTPDSLTGFAGIVVPASGGVTSGNVPIMCATMAPDCYKMDPIGNSGKYSTVHIFEEWPQILKPQNICCRHLECCFHFVS